MCKQKIEKQQALNITCYVCSIAKVCLFIKESAISLSQRKLLCTPFKWWSSCYKWIISRWCGISILFGVSVERVHYEMCRMATKNNQCGCFWKNAFACSSIPENSLAMRKLKQKSCLNQRIQWRGYNWLSCASTFQLVVRTILEFLLLLNQHSSHTENRVSI